MSKTYGVWTKQELIDMPNISRSQADDLKVDTGSVRIWVSRLTREDGVSEDNEVTIERLIDGRWVAQS